LDVRRISDEAGRFVSAADMGRLMAAHKTQTIHATPGTVVSRLLTVKFGLHMASLRLSCSQAFSG